MRSVAAATKGTKIAAGLALALLAGACNSNPRVSAPARIGWEIAETHIFGYTEIMWFDAWEDNLVVLFRDGSAGVWQYTTGEFRRALFVGDFTDALLCRTEPPSLAVVNGNELEPTVSFYDLTTGRRRIQVRLDTGVGVVACAYDTQSQLFYCHSWHGQALLGINVASGKVRWQATFDDPVCLLAKVRPGGKGYVNFLTDKIIARDSAGKVLWEKPFPVVEGDNPAGVQPGGDVATVFRKTTKSIEAIALSDGRSLWAQGGADFDSLRAIGEDGSPQVFYLDGKLQITHLPDPERITVPEVKGLNDVILVPERQMLLCLPALEVVAKNEENHVYTWARSSHTLRVIDARTGDLLKFFVLAKPVMPSG